MRAGKYRHRVLVEEPIMTQDETGEEVASWLSHGRVWGSVEPLRGRERLQASELLAAMDTRICLRWSETMNRMDARWRLSHQNVIYNIESIAHVDMARKEIEVMASSGTNLG